MMCLSILKLSVGDMADWKVTTNKVIAKNLFESLEKLLNAKWTTWQTLDYNGKRTIKHVVEYEITEESN